MKLVLACLFLLTISYVKSEQIMEFPTVPDGFSQGSNTPILEIEAFWDLTCPDCKASAPVILQVLNDLKISTNQNLRFTVHIFPLPAHLNSFLFAKGVRAINRAATNQQDIWKYFQLAFDNQANYYTAAVQNTPINQVVNNFVSLVSSNMPAYNATYLASAFSDPLIAYEALLSWQYACYKNVIGTPTYLANGVQIDGSDSFTYQDWMNFIKQYIPTDNVNNNTDNESELESFLHTVIGALEQ